MQLSQFPDRWSVLETPFFQMKKVLFKMVLVSDIIDHIKWIYKSLEQGKYEISQTRIFPEYSIE